MTTMTTAQRIEEVKKSIAAQERAIGIAYLDGNTDAISYYKMHLKAFKSSLADLEKQLEDEQTFEPSDAMRNRCIDILRAMYRRYKNAADEQWRRSCDYGSESGQYKSAERNTTKAYDIYYHQLAFAAALLGMDARDLSHEVEGES